MAEESITIVNKQTGSTFTGTQAQINSFMRNRHPEDWKRAED